jgi:LacI family transcriptional regulator
MTEPEAVGEPPALPAAITLRDIARIAGVHPSTVSRALDPERHRLVSRETREQVEALARQLGYRPDLVARGLRRRQTRTAGLIVADIGNPFIAPVIRGAAHVLDAQGIMSLIADSEDDPERLQRAFESLLSRRVDAILLTAARYRDRVLVESMAVHVPVVLAVRSLPGSDVPTVTPDDRLGGRLAAEHLIGDCGRTRVAELCGPDDASSFVERSQGFRDGVAAGGATLLEVPVRAGYPSVEDGRRLMSLLLDDEPALPLGVFAHNDLMALGALEVLVAAGLRCPDDVALVGYNNGFFLRHVAPPLTSVEFPGPEVGRIAGRVALDAIAGRPLQQRLQMVPPRLVVRASTVPSSARGA